MSSNILFVDDENEIIEGYKRLFREKEVSEKDALAAELFGESEAPSSGDKHNIFTASQGLDAIEIVKKRLKEKDPIDIAFVDMRMPPGIDGSETAAEIRKLDSKIEIVIVTAYSDIDLAGLVERINRPDKLLYLKKPFATDEIVQLVNNLAEKNRLEKSQEKFLANISHELKTPLTAVMGFSKMLADDETVPGDARSMANMVYESAELMNIMIRDLIDTAMLGERKIVLDVQEFSVSKLLIAIEGEYSNTPKASRLKFVDADRALVCSGDRLRIMQCLNHLISNAIKFSDEIVEISAVSENGEIVFSVKDCGVGIAKREQRAIFRRFYRVEDEHHEKEGMGLGLSICKQIIKLHGGDIRVMSAPGEGSIFSIAL